MRVNHQKKSLMHKTIICFQSKRELRIHTATFFPSKSKIQVIGDTSIWCFIGFFWGGDYLCYYLQVFSISALAIKKVDTTHN